MSAATSEWREIPESAKYIDADGVRWVMDHVEGHGTCLVRWTGDGTTCVRCDRPHSAGVTSRASECSPEGWARCARSSAVSTPPGVDGGGDPP